MYLFNCEFIITAPYRIIRESRDIRRYGNILYAHFKPNIGMSANCAALRIKLHRMPKYRIFKIRFRGIKIIGGRSDFGFRIFPYGVSRNADKCETIEFLKLEFPSI